MEKLVQKPYNCQDCQEKYTLGRGLEFSIECKSGHSPNKSFFSIKNQDPTHIVPGGWMGQSHYLVYSRNFHSSSHMEAVGRTIFVFLTQHTPLFILLPHIHQLFLGGEELG